MNEKKFEPYIAAEKITSEFTITSIIMGVILAVVFGAANAYLGLRVGMTVSASIPAAVISMGVIRVLLHKNSILENNMVQTIGSAGESLAAGSIFTLPALFLWAAEGKMENPGIPEISIIALCGGILGVLFMVPLRNALIVREHQTLPYPEGTACAEVLLAGEEGGNGAKTVFTGMGFAGVCKLLVDGFQLIPGNITAKISSLRTELSTQVYPALIGVGYICGCRISAYMLAGGVLGWFVLIPLINLFGENAILYPGEAPITALYSEGGASAIWSLYIRYIGAGAVAAGGMISLLKSLPLIFSTFRDSIKSLSAGHHDEIQRTSQELNMSVILFSIVVIMLLLWLIPIVPVTLLGSIVIIVFGFFFATVSSRMVGLVGSSNNPVSGMAIATLLFSTIILRATGDNGFHGMQGAIAIGSIICIIACMAGDTSQDLKTGYLLGATPRKQQLGELIGTVVAALAIGGVLYLLHAAWGFGSAELSAPQATLMKMLVEGVMDGNLPWGLVFTGVFIAITIEILRIPVLPVAIGLYLPLELSTCIMIGGLVRLAVNHQKSDSKEQRKDSVNRGILFSSGMIAGEGLIGIVLAILAVLSIGDSLHVPSRYSTGLVGGVVLLLIIVFSLLKSTAPRKQSTSKK